MTSLRTTRARTDINSAYYRFVETTHSLEVFALRNIKTGEEITFSCNTSSFVVTRMLANRTHQMDT